MPATPPTADHQPLPTVVIIGNDAVLAAAPATPVQLAHACLQRGFTVAVPASWGDELVAGEAVRRLATREQGPAVMCVCPYVRSRLLAPGPDLAPFLIALVAPPVATARYLRSIYAARGVHITYIGGCPSADDPVIDVRLTPDAFLAELAEHGIALSEQPLVFDSIVPPDRRRWCSLPGGVPSTEVLWNESDSRTLVEIDRDEASTDLVQHIIGSEHVLLDLATSLGCACSGAGGSVPARSARAAVLALEPPRAFGPVIDPAVLVSLDASLGSAEVMAAGSGQPPHVTDEGRAHAGFVASTARSGTDTLGSAATLLDTGSQPIEGNDQAAHALTESAGNVAHESHAASQRAQAPELAAEEHISSFDTATEYVRQFEQLPGRSERGVADPPPASDSPSSTPPPIGSVRRRTAASVAVRHPPANIPRTGAGGGRPLPRAYVAKRRTPAAGTASIAGAERPSDPIPAPLPPRDDTSSDVAEVVLSAEPPVPTASPEAPDNPVASTPALATDAGELAGATEVTSAAGPAAEAPPGPGAVPPSDHEEPVKPATERPSHHGSDPASHPAAAASAPGGTDSAAVRSSGEGALVVLMVVAVVVLGVFVLARLPH